MFNKKEDSKIQMHKMKVAQLVLEGIEPKTKYKISEKLSELIGLEIVIPKKFHKALKLQQKISKRHSAAMDYHAERYQEVNKHYWNLIEASVPDLDFKKYKYQIDPKTLTLSCMGANREQWDK